jgi:hypothetical protein
MAPSIIQETHLRAVEPRRIPVVLADAHRVQVPLAIALDETPDAAPCPAHLALADSRMLLIQLETADFAAGDVQGKPVTATLSMDHLQYTFQTTVRAVSQADPRTWRLELPASMHLVERRQAPRRRLHRAATVHLAPQSAPGADRASDICGRLLNVSGQGLACRLAAEAAATLSPTQPVSVAFRLDDHDRTFAFRARIVSITEGGTPGQMVIGIEFIDGATRDAQQDALQAALAGA